MHLRKCLFFRQFWIAVGTGTNDCSVFGKYNRKEEKMLERKGEEKLLSQIGQETRFY
jgi:hypothetical protein